MSGFGGEKSARLAFSLEALAAGGSASPPGLRSPDERDAASPVAQERTTEPPGQLTHALKGALGKLDLGNARKPPAAEHLLGALSALWTGEAAVGQLREGDRLSEVAEALAWDLLGQVALGTYSLVLQNLLDGAGDLVEELVYWREIEENRFSAGQYLLQTLPFRTTAVCKAFLARLSHLRARAGAANEPPRTRWETARLALPTGLLVTSAFPHLAASRSAALIGTARSAFYFTLSPVLLARQEARRHRLKLEELRDAEAERIGAVAEGIVALESAVQKVARGGDRESTRSALTGLVFGMRASLEGAQQRCPTAFSGGSPNACLDDVAPASPAELAQALRFLLSSDLPYHRTTLSGSLSVLSRPPLMTRYWPVLVAAPLALLTATKVVWSYRDPLRSCIASFRETVRGFFLGWVVKPVEDILSTVRAGERGTLAIMSKDSLESDMESLQRMVGDFGRDRYKWGEAEVRSAVQRVKEGDLTEVLRAWEGEIKTPFRSAVGGSLVRALLIQVQKVKVDLALAMDGIQKMLRSQQLTFGAIGVAPSMLVCYLLAQALGGLVKRPAGVAGQGTKTVRREVRTTMRRVERLLLLASAPPPQVPSSVRWPPAAAAAAAAAAAPAGNPRMTLGLLFLDLSYLRSFAASAHFPSSASKGGGRRAREEFLQDIRDLEEFGVGWDVKSRIAERMWRHWAGPLGLDAFAG